MAVKGGCNRRNTKDMPRKKFKIDPSKAGTIIRRMEVPFTQIANTVLMEKRISLRAKGLFAYMFGKPAGYEFDSKRIAKDNKEGREAVRIAMKELIAIGFLTRKKLKTGRNYYELIYPRTGPKIKKGLPTEEEYFETGNHLPTNEQIDDMLGF